MRARRLGVDTQQENIVFMRQDCPVCRSEGFTAHARIRLSNGGTSIIATLYQVSGDILDHGEAGLSDSAWRRLGVNQGDAITVSHPRPVASLSRVRGKVYGTRLGKGMFHEIIEDIVEGRYSDIHLSSFITACAAQPLDYDEMAALTHAMVDVGDRLDWGSAPIVDKHCIGGLPGNRTTPIIVAIVAASGLTMPKTSSRAITSPAGTADAMEVLAPVELDLATMRRVVEREGGCVVWGGAVQLSPADDILIRVERALDLDAEGQLVASVLSKKVAAGSTHVVLDLPVGPTAKLRDDGAAERVSEALTEVAKSFELNARTVCTDGSQPVGRGIGPALEARDVLAVLRGAADAPADLRDRATLLAGAILELSGKAQRGDGQATAESVLESGEAWAKFQRICEAQGGMRKPPRSRHQRPLLAGRAGQVANIDNRRIAKVAKLAGAPDVKASGVDLHIRLGAAVQKDQPLFTVHADAPGELEYAFEFALANSDIVELDDA
jgi:thymidine phosphorylase